MPWTFGIVSSQRITSTTKNFNCEIMQIKYSLCFYYTALQKKKKTHDPCGNWETCWFSELFAWLFIGVTQSQTKSSSLSTDCSTPTSYQTLTWWLSSPLAHVLSLECRLFPLPACSSFPGAKRKREWMTKKTKTEKKVNLDFSFEAVFLLC